MPRMRVPVRVAAGLSAAVLAAPAVGQAPKVEDALARLPAQPGVVVTTPAGADLAGCRVEVATYPKPATGYRVLDAQGRPVRQVIDTTGAGRPNMVYFYHNGAEAYREIDASGNGKPDQFRWLGVNGGKWGADADEDGVVDQWYDLSPAELSQEVFAAVQGRDPKRLTPLVLTAADAKLLGLPDSEAAKLLGRAANAAKRLQDAAAAMALTPQAKWVHAEVGVPFVVPGDGYGSKADLVKLPAVTVLYEKGDGKTADVFQTGELVQVGRVWKLVDGPAAGAAQAPQDAGGPGPVVVPDAVKEVVARIGALQAPANPAELPKYHAQRADLLEQVVAATAGEQRTPWLRQLVDAHTAAAAGGPADGPHLARLKQWVAAAEKDDPKSAGYAAFRTLDAEYTARMTAAPAGGVAGTQTWLRQQLEAFITKYPAGEDTAEAMMRLATAHEFAGAGGEAQAKTWYEKLAVAFPGDVRAAKAAGAVKRMQSEGQVFTLPAASTTDGKPFDPASLAGKPAVVYYFANWGTDPAAEARVVDDLKKLGEAAKGVTVVTVSLDESAARAQSAVTAANLPGVHLFAPGGLDRSPLAVAYGVQMVPHLMLVGKDGKVANRNAQSGPGLAAEIEKLAK